MERFPKSASIFFFSLRVFFFFLNNEVVCVLFSLFILLAIDWGESREVQSDGFFWTAAGLNSIRIMES